MGTLKLSNWSQSTEESTTLNAGLSAAVKLIFTLTLLCNGAHQKLGRLAWWNSKPYLIEQWSLVEMGHVLMMRSSKTSIRFLGLRDALIKIVSYTSRLPNVQELRARFIFLRLKLLILYFGNFLFNMDEMSLMNELMRSISFCTESFVGDK